MEEKGGYTAVTPNQIQNPSPEDVVDVIELENNENGGCVDPLSPINIREQRVAKARRALGLKSQRDRGDQADQAAAEDDRTTDVNTALQLLHSQDEGVIRKVLRRLRVKWYHWETERLQSIFKSAGIRAKACNIVPQVMQACQLCRPWKRPAQTNKLITI